MCGIAGVIKSSPLLTAEIAAVRQMTQALFHRGPDGAGEYMDADYGASPTRLFMSMRRLSIVDLNGGWQPLKSEDETIALVANGEIYNHLELRSRLSARGHRFRTGSDCEVIIHLYEEFGTDFTKELRGMFAFALWDSRKRRLILGRDRMGEKPLYLHVANDRVLFASELKAMLASGELSLSVDVRAIHEYLHFGWIPDPRTAVAGIRKLEPGHILIVDVATWSVQDRCYWRLEDAPVVVGDPVSLVRDELEVIGRQIVRADVPVGIALSGGFDSSLAAAIAARHSNTPVQAFTVGYEGAPGQDEREDARIFARELDLPFHSIEVATSDMVAAFPKVAFDRDDPISDIAGYGYHVISQQARAAGCPVLLQGQGADELLWGYPWAVQAVNHSLRKFGAGAIPSLSAFWAQLPSDFSRPQWVRFAYVLGGLFAGWRSLSPGSKSPLAQLVAYDLTDPYQIGAHSAHSTYAPAFSQRVLCEHADPGEFFRYVEGQRIDIQLLALLCRGYLLQNGLAQGDRLSMANSVELRLPLVDHKLAELLVGLQKHRPAYLERPKALLHEAASPLVPPHVLNRPKRGFNPPVTTWISALRERYGDELPQGLLVQNGILNVDAAKALSVSRSRFGMANDLFLKYLVLEFWYRGMQSIAATSRTRLPQCA